MLDDFIKKKIMIENNEKITTSLITVNMLSIHYFKYYVVILIVILY